MVHQRFWYVPYVEEVAGMGVGWLYLYLKLKIFHHTKILLLPRADNFTWFSIRTIHVKRTVLQRVVFRKSTKCARVFIILITADTITNSNDFQCIYEQLFQSWLPNQINLVYFSLKCYVFMLLQQLILQYAYECDPSVTVHTIKCSTTTIICINLSYLCSLLYSRAQEHHC